jgi:hypothetical protein
MAHPKNKNKVKALHKTRPNNAVVLIFQRFLMFPWTQNPKLEPDLLLNCASYDLTLLWAGH